MKTKLRIKQFSKFLIHFLIFGSIIGLWIFGVNLDFTSNSFTFSWDIANVNSWWFGFITIPYILLHILTEWLMEHTPLRTKELKKRVHNIQDTLTIEEKKK